MTWTLVAAVGVVWAALEGPTIVTAVRAPLSGGAARLDRLGYAFLATEAWTLALLGLQHGILPRPTHELFGRLPWAPALFVAGWMIRDLGLWLGPRLGAGRGWLLVIGLGGALQVIGALSALIGLAVLRPAPEAGAGAALLITVCPPVLLLGAALWWLLRRTQSIGRENRACATVPPPTRAAPR